MLLAVDEHQVAMVVGQQRQRKHVIYAKLPHRQILNQTHSSTHNCQDCFQHHQQA